MTKREAAIVSAYTGYLIGEFSDFHAYVEEIMGRPVFTHELPNIAEKLKEKSKKDFMSIKIEEKEDPPEFLAKYMNIRVPDCNDCGYLNFTEKEQQVYGINSYKKDHRCKCYDRPVYHRTNSTQHNPYIHPCEECYKDNFVNYYDCESSRKGE